MTPQADLLRAARTSTRHVATCDFALAGKRTSILVLVDRVDSGLLVWLAGVHADTPCARLLNASEFRTAPYNGRLLDPAPIWKARWAAQFSAVYRAAATAPSCLLDEGATLYRAVAFMLNAAMDAPEALARAREQTRLILSRCNQVNALVAAATVASTAGVEPLTVEVPHAPFFPSA